MKKITLIISLFFIVIGPLYSQEQEPATEAGEDFDLNAVMEVLENAEDLGDFEKKINDEKNQVTNLDLDENDQVDFIKVVEYDEENTRLLVLQAVLKDNEFQDIATIEIEKHSEEEISLQVVGDPDIYGPDYILEPAPDDSNGDSGGGDCFSSMPEVPEYVSLAVFVSVHRWRPIRHLIRVLSQSGSFNDDELYYYLENTLVDWLVDCLSDSVNTRPERKFEKSDFDNIVDYIQSNISEVSSVSKLSQNTHFSERTLRRWFKKKYDITPKQYINVLRLNKVRKALKNDQGDSSILEVASEFNFWHMGQFTRDYKNLFGELPSKTIKTPN